MHFFSWLLCTSVKKLEDDAERMHWSKAAGWWEKWVGGRWEFHKSIKGSEWWRRNRAVFLHILPSTTCLSFHSYPPLIQSSALSASPLGGTRVPLEINFNMRKEKQTKNKILHLEPTFRNNDCIAAAGREINPASCSLCPNFKSSNVFLTLSEIWKNFVFWVLDSCYCSSAMHSIITTGMLSVCYSGFKPWRTAIKYWSKIPSMAIEIRLWREVMHRKEWTDFSAVSSKKTKNKNQLWFFHKH